ncbi:azurin [Achromobacter anxifer]
MRVFKYALSIALLASAAPVVAGECAIEVDASDQMQFDKKEIDVPKECKSFAVTLKHTGKLPINVMGHNWVLTKASDLQAVAADGMSAGVANGYLKTDDSRVIAATKLLGGGQTDTVNVDVPKLSAGESYAFFCSFPGHSAIMKGSLKVAG